jgi:hypothetical protein
MSTGRVEISTCTGHGTVEDHGPAIRGSVELPPIHAVNLETAKEQADALRQKIVVGISNPLNESYDALVTEGGSSAAENIQAAIGPGAKVVKAFNTTFAGTLVACEVRRPDARCLPRWGRRGGEGDGNHARAERRPVRDRRGRPGACPPVGGAGTASHHAAVPAEPRLRHGLEARAAERLSR